MEVVDSGIKILATIPFTIVDKLLIVMGEMDIGIIPDPLPPIIQVVLVNYWDCMFMDMRVVDIGLRPSTLLPITMVDYKISTQGYLKMIFLRVFYRKIFKTVIKTVAYIHIKTISIILIQ